MRFFNTICKIISYLQSMIEQGWANCNSNFRLKILRFLLEVCKSAHEAAHLPAIAKKVTAIFFRDLFYLDLNRLLLFVALF